ncbi:TRAP-type C4-dicarboxylate transport system, substrate-binding protein [Modicisalibacter ilicicola DSM 19980]|uniref:TRAP-type C4-dicarboxylate transport system, substrate-binding protein n=1 Tax=Modicisalibacter ilicicola DSM 19980 TaxID=1121942 RepID=A0A1M4YWX0_9GAMM|nr:TRAP transporter substrate-binding protein [Halomonas ilicicola]SHF10283.1 TRAP-type C4-dicarboxylate transport system, substrate-binding protein [Halomonas ilicicola DSM 19980]
MSFYRFGHELGHKFVTLSLVAAGLAATLNASAQAATEWDMPTPYGDRTFHTVNIREFADDVRERTDGELDITVHAGGSLIAHPEIKNSVRRGIVPLGEVIMSRLANENAIFEVDSVPYLASSYDDARTLWEASQEIIGEELAKQRLRLLFTVPWPPQGIYTQEKVEAIDDLENLKMRAYNKSSERLAQLAGAVPTQIEVPDIPTAFSTGRVDAMVTSPATGADTKAWDYLEHFNHAQLWLPKNMVIVNEQAFSRLDEKTRQAVLEAADAAQQRGWEMSRKETEDALEVLRDNGITVSEPSEELAASLEEIGTTMTEEWRERAGEQGEQIIENYRELQQ